MRTHVPGTWLLANLLHPFMAFIMLGWLSDRGIEAFGLFFTYLMYSMLLSVPALIAGAFADKLLPFFFKSGLFRFLAWLIIAILLVLLNIQFLYLFTADSFSLDELYFSYPALISVFIASLWRMKTIFRFYHEKTIAPNESDTIL